MDLQNCISCTFSVSCPRPPPLEPQIKNDRLKDNSNHFKSTFNKEGLITSLDDTNKTNQIAQKLFFGWLHLQHASHQWGPG